MPKCHIRNIIKKCFILWNIEINHKIPIYYKFNLSNKSKMKIPCIIVDFNKNNMIWDITFIDENNNIYSCSIDDISGNIC